METQTTETTETNTKQLIEELEKRLWDLKIDHKGLGDLAAVNLQRRINHLKNPDSPEFKKPQEGEMDIN